MPPRRSTSQRPTSKPNKTSLRFLSHAERVLHCAWPGCGVSEVFQHKGQHYCRRHLLAVKVRE
jgi:hypothetical protein